ncbi:UTP--glucose-1-phosphate uridylyltransferase [Rhodococcus antarcticus]|jgi:UTP--glucose-1-phosphate uridylyltransferase|uniref:UTP--glucose-1-phosphate uridylyltransferase n=1 Tax=Rhodococcus antarcticus TaxID=2987751 RepID=A0ABY6NXI3_9NOCA|nr:UTP--glucose-1-phosphate uridylyltransferase [Rhodococcus antarcticus]UZJ24104.1 UTP--glucose-1-phosphate uridylyltransferase [Rhodococcus antarcticus]
MTSPSPAPTSQPGPGFRTAIVPAAGLGTRFLPATRSVAKELLPLVDTPGIEMVATEAAAAGASRMVVVISAGKEAVAAHFQPDPELEATLAGRGKDELLAKVRRAPALLGEVRAVLQDEPLGLGHAVGCAEGTLDDDETVVAVLLPDDLVLTEDGEPGVLERMAAVRSEHGGTVLCAFEVPREEVSAYGVFAVEGDGGDRDVFRVVGMVEKPTPDEAPSSLAAAGRYLLDRAVFDALRRTTPGAGGELQLTDAIALLIDEGHPVHVVVHRGARHDIGNPGGYVRAVVDFALRDAAYGPSLQGWLGERLDRS